MYFLTTTLAEASKRLQFRAPTKTQSATYPNNYPAYRWELSMTVAYKVWLVGHKVWLLSIIASSERTVLYYPEDHIISASLEGECHWRFFALLGWCRCGIVGKASVSCPVDPTTYYKQNLQLPFSSQDLLCSQKFNLFNTIMKWIYLN